MGAAAAWLTQAQLEGTPVHRRFDVRLFSNAIVMVTLPRFFSRTNESSTYSQESAWILMQQHEPAYVHRDRRTDGRADRQMRVSRSHHHKWSTFHCDKNSVDHCVIIGHTHTHTDRRVHQRPVLLSGEEEIVV